MGLVATILALLTNLGVRLFGIRAHVKGENDEMRRARIARELEAQMLVTKGSSNQKGNEIEQVRVDASNVLRNDLGKAVLFGVMSCGGDVLSEDSFEKFRLSATKDLAQRIRDYFVVAEGLGATHLLFVLDRLKSDFNFELLQKGRHTPGAPLASAKILARLSSFAQGCASKTGRGGQWASVTRRETVSPNVSAVADLLHRSPEGSALLRLMLTEAVRLVLLEFPKLASEVAENYEADMSCIPDGTTFQNGKLTHADGALVSFSSDSDGVTDLSYGPGCQERFRLQLLFQGTDLRIRAPENLAEAVRREVCQSFADNVKSPRDLCVVDLAGDWTLVQKMNLFNNLAIVRADCTERCQESLSLKDPNGKFIRPSDLYHVVRAFYAINKNKGADADISWPHLVWVAEHGKISHFDGKDELRRRLVAALKDVKQNQLDILYAAYSRLIQMFPLATHRQPVIRILDSFFPRQKMWALYNVVNKLGWRNELLTLNFVPTPVVLDRKLAMSFMAKFFGHSTTGLTASKDLCRPIDALLLVSAACKQQTETALPRLFGQELFYYLDACKVRCKPKAAVLLVMDACMNYANAELPARFGMALFLLLDGQYGTFFGAQLWEQTYKRNVITLKSIVRADGQFGLSSTDASGEDGGTRTKKPKKPKPKNGQATVVPMSSGYRSYDGEFLSVEGASESLGDFFKTLASDNGLREYLKKIQNCADEEIGRLLWNLGAPLLLPGHLVVADMGPRILVVAQAMTVGQDPLVHDGYLGNVLRFFTKHVDSRSPYATPPQWLSTDVLPQPRLDDCFDAVCPDCQSALFPHDQYWWHPFHLDCLCDVCEQIKTCETCQDINEALWTFGQLRVRHQCFLLQPTVLLSLGNVALSAIDGAIALNNSLESSAIHILHPAAVARADPSQRKDTSDTFWDSFCSAVQSLDHVLFDRNLCEMSRKEQITLYKLARGNVLQSKVSAFPQIPSMERHLALEKTLLSGTVHGNAGTRGLVATNGKPNDQAMAGASATSKSDKPKLSKPVKSSVPVSATRRGIPIVSAIVNGTTARNAFDEPQRVEFANLLVSRLKLLHSFQNHLLSIASLANNLRTAFAADSGTVRVFDRVLMKAMLKDLVCENQVAEKNLLDYGIPLPLHAAFEALRKHGRLLIYDHATRLGLEDIFVTLFISHLGDDMVTRLDVPAKSQVLSIMRMLFCIKSEGVSNNAFLMLFLTFSHCPEPEIRAELDVVEENEQVEEPTGPVSAQADVSSDGFLDDDYKPPEEHLEKKKSVSDILLSNARRAWHRLSKKEKNLVLKSGAWLHKTISSLVPDAEFWNKDTPFQRYDSFRTDMSFGVATSRAKSAAPLYRIEGRSIGAVRAGLFAELLKEMPGHKGFRQSPLPSRSVPFHLRKTEMSTCASLSNFLVGAMSETEKRQFPQLNSVMLASIDVRYVTIQSLFNCRDRFRGRHTIVNAIMYNGGSDISAFAEAHSKATATQFLKFKPNGASLDDLLNNPAQRLAQEAVARERAERRLNGTSNKKKKERAEMDDDERRIDDETQVRLKGPATRMPLAKKTGFVTEARLFESLAKTREEDSRKNGVPDSGKNKEGKRERKSGKSNPKFVFSARVESAPPSAAPSSDTGDGVKFVIRLQSGADAWEQAEALLDWLKQHPLVVLDPGQRWVVRGIVARFIKGTICHDTGQVSLTFAYRGIRVSGHKWNHYREEAAGTRSPEAESKLQAGMQSIFDDLAATEVLTAAEMTEKVKAVFAQPNVSSRIRASCEKLLDGAAVRRQEARFKHQNKIALNFVRKISNLCKGHGDPIVIIGEAGGNGGRGRAQVNHDLLLKTLAGFFCVVLLDEYCTSKKTTCCHQDAHVPNRGRSRGCKNCCDGLTKWWDRDEGASWNMLSIFISLLLTGARPDAMTKAAKTTSK